jgi:hypothetical protein
MSPILLNDSLPSSIIHHNWIGIIHTAEFLPSPSQRRQLLVPGVARVETPTFPAADQERRLGGRQGVENGCGFAFRDRTVLLNQLRELLCS